MSKVALITGANRGIGKQIAITLAKQGFDIAINYRTATDSLNEVIKELNLEKIETVHARMEEYSKNNIEKYDVVTARAVSNMTTLTDVAVALSE